VAQERSGADPDRQDPKDQPDQRDTGGEEHEVQVNLLAVLEDEPEHVGREHDEDDQPRPEAGLLLAQLLLIGLAPARHLCKV